MRNREIKKELDLFYDLATELLKEEELTGTAEMIPVEELKDHIDYSLQDEAMLESEFVEELRSLILKTPRTATTRFFNQLFGGRIGKAVLGDLLSVLLNNSMYTYKVAGPQVAVEKEIIRKTSELCGYGNRGAGTIAPGGSMSNLMAMIIARDVALETCRKEGVNREMTLYTSQNSHYSIKKNASFIGIGIKRVRYVASDDRGSMIPEELEAAIEQDLKKGALPFFINATAGTTVLGAFDPIRALSKIADKYNLWLHVDGAYCGSVIFSHKYKHLIEGIELSDSFSLNAHKMLGTPLTCSLFLTRHGEELFESFSTKADYLYQTEGDSFNLGKTSLQCGRRNDALKLWSLWKAIGTSGLKNIIDKQFELASVARTYIESHPDYTSHSLKESVSVCFNYKNIPADQLCTELHDHGELLVGYGQFKDQEFVRLVTVNSNNDAEDILAFFKTLEAFAEKKFSELHVQKN
jgi:sulfinoalanine decarboxylase/sulfinoalanine decarboxylase/aspartate 1-decarboxylase